MTLPVAFTASAPPAYPPLRQDARHRRARPRIRLRRDLRESNRGGQRLVVSDGGGGAAFGVQRPQHAGDPGGAIRVEALDELAPGRLARFPVIGGAPGLLPEVFAPDLLLLGQLGLVGVDVHLVRIDADAQVEAAVRERREPRLQPHGQQ
jgi:hypothetical protein